VRSLNSIQMAVFKGGMHPSLDVAERLCQLGAPPEFVSEIHPHAKQGWCGDARLTQLNASSKVTAA